MTPKNIHVGLRPFFGKKFLKNKVFEIDNGNNIFFGFKKRMSKKGVEVNTLDTTASKKATVYVYCDVPYPWEMVSWFQIIFTLRKKVLLNFESPTTNPFSQLKLFHYFFDKIYTWNDQLVDNKKIFKLIVPQLSGGIVKKPLSYANKKFIVLINSNKKLPASFYILSKFKSNLYKERAKAINFFEKKKDSNFDLYGRGWNKSKKLSFADRLLGFQVFKTYKGEIADNKKISILAKYKYCLCIENTSAEGYITEKIIDCFKAGVVPVYLGAPNIEHYINKSSFIDLRAFPTYSKLYKYLCGLSEEEYNQYLANGRKVIYNSQFYNQWFEKGFDNLFLSAVK